MDREDDYIRLICSVHAFESAGNLIGFIVGIVCHREGCVYNTVLSVLIEDTTEHIIYILHCERTKDMVCFNNQTNHAGGVTIGGSDHLYFVDSLDRSVEIERSIGDHRCTLSVR